MDLMRALLGRGIGSIPLYCLTKAVQTPEKSCASELPATSQGSR